MTAARSTSRPGPAHSADGRGGADARVRRSAWLFAAVAVLVYVGYLAYYFWRSAGRG